MGVAHFIIHLQTFIDVIVNYKPIFFGDPPNLGNPQVTPTVGDQVIGHPIILHGPCPFRPGVDIGPGMTGFPKMGLSQQLDGFFHGKSEHILWMITGGTPMTQKTSIWIGPTSIDSELCPTIPGGFGLTLHVTNKSLKLLSPKYPHEGLRGSIVAGVQSQHSHGKWPIEIDYLPVKECDIAE